MATLLDVGLLQYIEVVFPVILVFAVVYAVLYKTKVIGDKPTLNAIIAIITGLLMVVSDKAGEVINFMIPWFSIAIIFLLMLFLLLKLFGLSDDNLTNVLKDKAVYWSIILVALAIFGAAFLTVFGQDVLDVNTGDSEPSAFSDVIKVLTSPKILGLAVLIAIAVAAIFLLTG
jgi:hypothetical protein